MHIGDSSTHSTGRGLIDGWVTGLATRIRQARPADLPALAGILALAGVPLLSGVRHAVEDGSAATALHAGLDDSPQAFIAAAAPATGDLDRAITEVAPAVSLVLVAEHDRHGIVAGLMAAPPVYLLAHLRTDADASRDHEQLRTLLLRCTKIQAMAVTEPARGHRLGAALLHRCCAVYRRCGHRLVYGQTPPNRDPAEYYRQEGFDVLEPGEPLDLEPACGLHTQLTPAATERICIFLQSPPGL
ncbi:GNAT family N-acetyltransferase [Sciscionella marina]|uniref:GNAT family N-acetyltransferase n=1 Tax=Sciscionella marina TaxID=508770 RepID=UPI00035CD766|nr:GNAT family N-acetyltransferase [Sciscionella marina]